LRGHRRHARSATHRSSSQKPGSGDAPSPRLGGSPGGELLPPGRRGEGPPEALRPSWVGATARHAPPTAQRGPSPNFERGGAQRRGEGCTGTDRQVPRWCCRWIEIPLKGSLYPGGQPLTIRRRGPDQPKSSLSLRPLCLCVSCSVPLPVSRCSASLRLCGDPSPALTPVPAATPPVRAAWCS